jgi:hypothetical protein
MLEIDAARLAQGPNFHDSRRRRALQRPRVMHPHRAWTWRDDDRHLRSALVPEHAAAWRAGDAERGSGDSRTMFFVSATGREHAQAAGPASWGESHAWAPLPNPGPGALHAIAPETSLLVPDSRAHYVHRDPFVLPYGVDRHDPFWCGARSRCPRIRHAITRVGRGSRTAVLRLCYGVFIPHLVGGIPALCLLGRGSLMSSSATSGPDWGHMLAFGCSGLLAALEFLVLFGSLQETRPYSSESVFRIDISASFTLLLLLCAMSAIFGFVASAILGIQGVCRELRQ